MKRLDKEARVETMSVTGCGRGKIGNIQRKDERISPQRSKRGSPHQRRVPSSRGKGLDHDTATSSAEIVSLQGMKIATFEQLWSVMVSMESYPFEGGNLTIKSIATVSKGNARGMGKMGCRVAWVQWVLTLFH